MKTVLSIFTGMAAGAVFAVGQPEVQVVTFSSQGTDTYEDGSAVLDGECYALVWSPDGQFGGIDGNGGAKREGDKVVYIGDFAKDGRCRSVEFHVANGYFTEYERKKVGKFALWVLDTRVFKDGEQTSFGKQDGGGVIVSYAAPAAEAVVAASFGAGAPGAITGTGAQAGQSTTDLANLQPPVIDGPYFEKDASGAQHVRIGLKKTVPGAKYAILGADNVMMKGAKEGVVTTGTGEDLTVIAPDTGSFKGNFYKAVVR